MATSMSGSKGATGQALTGGNIIPKGHKYGQLQQFTPEQMNLFQQMFSQVSPGSYLSKLAGGDEGTFQQLEAPALKQFGQLQGQIGSRFSQFAPGAMSAQRGSGFKNTLNQASSDFAQQLQSQRMELQRQALQDMLGISQGLLGQRPYKQFLTKKPPSFWQSLIGAVGENAGAITQALVQSKGIGAPAKGTTTYHPEQFSGQGYDSGDLSSIYTPGEYYG